MKKMPKVVHEGEECFFNKSTRRLNPVDRPWESIALSEFQYAHYDALTTPVFFRPRMMKASDVVNDRDHMDEADHLV